MTEYKVVIVGGKEDYGFMVGFQRIANLPSETCCLDILFITISICAGMHC